MNPASACVKTVRLIVVPSVFLAFSLAPCLADCPPEITFSKSPQTLGVLRTFALDIGDVDHDGDHDVFVASYHDNYFGPSQLWLNNGDRTFTLSPQSFPLSDVHGVAIRDLNGDTHPDIFLISQASPSKVFFNDGSGTFSAGSQNIGLSTNNPFQIEMGDIDDDSDLDAIVATGVGIQVWRNDGTGVFSLSTTLAAGRVGCISVADVNADTYPDLFISFVDQSDEMWLNDGSGGFINSGQALGTATGYGYPSAGDIDGDGDVDFAVGNSVEGITIWLNQDNTGSFLDAGIRLEPGAYRAGLFDADGDGDLDLVSSHLTYGTKLWKNIGSVSFSLVGPISESAGALCIGFGDLDDDADTDVVFGYSETCGGNPVYFNATDNACYGTVTDMEGNTYGTVKIGTQVWMGENLRVMHYRNGDPIPLVADSANWVSQTTGAYCDYANDTNNTAQYGRLYNWHAATDSRNIAPAGWHVATDAEWQILCDYLGGTASAGWKLKEGGTAHWLPPNSGSNESGFSALPGGYRGSSFGVFADLGNYATFWTATALSGTHAWYRSISYDVPTVDVYDSRKFYGFSVRCVKDTSCCTGTTGNVNITGIVDLSDLSALVSYLTGGGYVLTCAEEANINRVGIVDLSDLSALVSYLTGGGYVLPNCA